MYRRPPLDVWTANKNCVKTAIRIDKRLVRGGAWTYLGRRENRVLKWLNAKEW